MKVLIFDGLDGDAVEVDLQECVRAAAASASPEVGREAAMIADLMSEYPEAGSQLLYSLYRTAGGRVGWKVFRRIVADFRGVGGRPIATASQEMLLERRRLRMFEQAEAKEQREQREKEKAEMATIRREDLRRGQRVYVRVRYGDQMKLRPAKINEVMRAAVNLSIEGENTPRTVRFNEIELSMDGAVDKVSSATAPSLAAVPSAFAALGDGRGVQSVQQPQPRPHVEVRRPSPPPSPQPDPAPEARPADPSPADDLGQVNAWIEQGAAMRESLVKKQDALRADMDNLAAEALRIEEALTAKKAEMVRITAMLTAIDQIRGAAA